MGNLPVWSEKECTDSGISTIEQMIFERGSAAGARSKSFGLIVTSGMRSFVEQMYWPLGIDDLTLWRCWVKYVWI